MKPLNVLLVTYSFPPAGGQSGAVMRSPAWRATFLARESGSTC